MLSQAFYTSLLLPLVAGFAFGDATFTKVHHFNSGEFIENLAVRSNGKILVSVLTEPILYQVDPSVVNGPATVVHQFANASGVTGILEISQDVFAVSAGVVDLRTLQGTAGTFAVYSVDIVIKDPLFLGNAQQPLGINGIKVRGNALCFTNSAQGTYGSISISNTGTATGPITIIDRITAAGFDDFAFDFIGTAYIANHPSSVEKISILGAASVELNSTTKPTSAAFGRGSKASTLYGTTGGEFRVPGGIGGQLFAVNSL